MKRFFAVFCLTVLATAIILTGCVTEENLSKVSKVQESPPPAGNGGDDLPPPPPDEMNGGESSASQQTDLPPGLPE